MTDSNRKNDSMNTAQKALFNKELQQASASLGNAFRILARDTVPNLDLIKKLKDEQRLLGAMLVTFNGGPVVSIQEMVH